MKDFANLYHHGIIVDDISQSMKLLGDELRIDWAPIRHFDPLRVWLPETGWSEAHLTVTYSRQGPIHYELIEARPSGAYEALRAISPAHVGAWVPDVGAGVEALLADGWRLIMAGASPEHRYGQIAYMAQGDGPVLELVAEAIRPVIQDWIGAQS